MYCRAWGHSSPAHLLLSLSTLIWIWAQLLHPCIWALLACNCWLGSIDLLFKRLQLTTTPAWSLAVYSPASAVKGVIQSHLPQESVVCQTGQVWASLRENQSLKNEHFRCFALHAYYRNSKAVWPCDFTSEEAKHLQRPACLRGTKPWKSQSIPVWDHSYTHVCVYDIGRLALIQHTKDSKAWFSGFDQFQGRVK